MSFALDCLLASYLLLASLTIWCAQVRERSMLAEPEFEIARGPHVPGVRQLQAVLRIVEPALAALPNAMGSVACLVGALSLVVGAPFELRYAAVAVFGVALYLILINMTHLIEDWQRGLPVARMVCVRSLLPALVASPMLLAGMRLL